jgi:hypothetical protein
MFLAILVWPPMDVLNLRIFLVFKFEIKRHLVLKSCLACPGSSQIFYRKNGESCFVQNPPEKPTTIPKLKQISSIRKR